MSKLFNMSKNIYFGTQVGNWKPFDFFGAGDYYFKQI